jgi:tRNA A37 threonylcarbamoyladenosine synthetase subunit TsaC/SUA5/YrdC
MAVEYLSIQQIQFMDLGQILLMRMQRKKSVWLKGRDEWKRYIFLIESVEILFRNMLEINSENYIDFLLSLWPNPISVILKLNAVTREILTIRYRRFQSA